MNHKTREGLHNLPPIERISPSVDAIRRHVYRLKRAEGSEPVTAEIEYVNNSGQLVQIAATFGKFATFAYRQDLAFTFEGSRAREPYTGILLIEGEEIRISTPFT